jgi:hypothetical protein
MSVPDLNLVGSQDENIVYQSSSDVPCMLSDLVPYKNLSRLKIVISSG